MQCQKLYVSNVNITKDNCNLKSLYKGLVLFLIQLCTFSFSYCFSQALSPSCENLFETVRAIKNVEVHFRCFFAKESEVDNPEIYRICIVMRFHFLWIP